MSEEIKTKEDYIKAAFEMAESNHIWVSAFSCINPSKDFCEKLGREIINKLKEKENLLPSWYGNNDTETLQELGKLTPMMFLSINKS